MGQDWYSLLFTLFFPRHKSFFNSMKDGTTCLDVIRFCGRTRVRACVHVRFPLCKIFPALRFCLCKIFPEEKKKMSAKEPQNVEEECVKSKKVDRRLFFVFPFFLFLAYFLFFLPSSHLPFLPSSPPPLQFGVECLGLRSGGASAFGNGASIGLLQIRAESSICCVWSCILASQFLN